MSHICASCRITLRRVFQERRRDLTASRSGQHAKYSIAPPRPPRIGIIGSGPAGFYSAHRIQQKLPDAKVDMYEMLPTPFGLVRYGVAPDHPEVKNCIDTFKKVAEHSSFTFIGNVSIGEGNESLPLSTLAQHYDALLFAYGASQDKRLGVPGEDLRGILSARAFVGWYNGLPEYAGLKPDLSNVSDVVIVGQGNVSMDVARMLLSPVSRIRGMPDVTEDAIQVFDQSRVKTVRIVGRRGPLQAAFTTKELRELINLEATTFNPPQFSPSLESYLPKNAKSLPRQLRRSVEVMLKGSASHATSNQRSWSLEYLLSPDSFEGIQGGLTKAVFQRTRLRQALDETDLSDVSGVKSTKVEADPDSQPVEIPADMAFRSVGYKSEPLKGMDTIGITFDEPSGIIPNDVYGRVLSPEAGPGSLSAGHVPGMYAAGWVKCGPTGVIASTMEDAFSSADAVLQDWHEGVPFLRGHPGSGESAGWDAVRSEVAKRSMRAISWEDWRRIDNEETRRGELLGKSREKFRNVKDMLEVLD